MQYVYRVVALRRGKSEQLITRIEPRDCDILGETIRRGHARNRSEAVRLAIRARGELLVHDMTVAEVLARALRDARDSRVRSAAEAAGPPTSVAASQGGQ